MTTSDKTVICNFLAYLYEEGCFNREYGNPKDLFEEIVRPIPFFYLGNMYAKGIGVSKNIKKALNYYESAVNIGHKEAMYELYSIYDSNTEFENKEEALKWLKAIAEIDNSFQAELAYRLIDGIGCTCSEQNDNQAFELLKKASQSGDKDVIHNLAFLYEKGRGCEVNYEKAKELFEKASFPSSLMFLGDMYENGLGVPKDIKKALEYYEAAYSAGHQGAIYYLFDIYDSDTEYGNKEDALKWLKTIEKIDNSFQAEFAYRLIDGIGCTCSEQNDGQAFELLKKASQSGNKTAIHNMAWLYKKGRGCDINYQKAKELFEEASRPHSFYHLGDMYENGLGVTKDMEKAIEYYKIGAEKGSESAINRLQELNENV
ncbi:Secretory immunoglobulin A-binding protein EsiB [Eubacterium plexicaudatum ASF492]|uniref:Uncharacterized protein n=1 Tax=Eubacterium plexicaudatum ASF492 TaxID=1235802 RepID=N1ZTW0_9FIRM|nr:Secretory immunoglobulin A-binding protein EsiB [Eubacterium plexicaudatum ASF492]